MTHNIPERKKEVIANRLKHAGLQSLCPMCGGEITTLIDGYIVPILQMDIKTINLSGKCLPTVAMVCSKCGYLRQHALGPLGLLENLQEKEEENVKTE